MRGNSTKQSQAVTPRKAARMVLPTTVPEPPRRLEVKVNVNVDVKVHLVIWALGSLMLTLAAIGIIGSV